MTQETLMSAIKNTLEITEQKDNPSRLKNLLALSQHLRDHPVIEETFICKAKYLEILESFVNNYAADSLFAAAALDNYKHAFLGDQYSSYAYSCKDIISDIKSITRTRFKSLKLFSYRLFLVIDISFICAFDDADKGSAIFAHIKQTYHKRYHKAIDDLYETLYRRAEPTKKLKAVERQISCWIKNTDYYERPLSTVLFVANMSAGKSTLINAIVGKKVSQSRSQACTAKLHYIISKAFEDGYSYEYDYLLDLNANPEVLMNDNVRNVTNEIIVSTAFRFVTPPRDRICFLDTPGANYSGDLTHSIIARQAIDDGSYDTLVYVFAAGTTGTHDEKMFLTCIKEHRKNCRLVFVFNKLDEYKDKEDSLDVSISNLHDDLRKMGFTDYELYPVSGYAGYMAKSVIGGETFLPNAPEFFQFAALKAQFKTPEFDFSKYFNIPAEVIDHARQSYAEYPEEFDLLLKSGMLGLEYVLTH